jgi:O-antigen ligase
MFAMTAYISWAVASVAWAQNTAQVKTLSTRLVTEALVLLAVGVFLQRPVQLRWLAWSILGAATAATTLGLLLGANLEGRAIGTFSDPNEYAASLVPALALGYVLIDDASSRLQAAVAAGMSAVCAYGLIGSQSRGGLLAAIAVGAVLFVTSKGRERFRLIGVGLAGVCFLVAVLFVTAAGQGLLERVSSTDTSGRSDLWKVAVKQFEANPLTGVGLGNYPERSVDFLDNDIQHRELFLGEPRTTHNVSLELMAELGIPGVIFFYTLVGTSVLAAVRSMRQGRKDPALSWSVPYARATLASIVGLVVAGVFISGQYQELLWVMMGVSFALSGIVARRVDVRGDEHTEPVTERI